MEQLKNLDTLEMYQALARWSRLAMSRSSFSRRRSASDAGAGEAPAQHMKLGVEVAVTSDEVSRRQQRYLDFVAVVVPDTSPTYLNFLIVPCCYIIILGCFIIILYHFWN